MTPSWRTSKSSRVRPETRLPLESVTTTSMLVMSTETDSVTGELTCCSAGGLGLGGAVCARALIAMRRPAAVRTFLKISPLAQNKRGAGPIIPRVDPRGDRLELCPIVAIGLPQKQSCFVFWNSTEFGAAGPKASRTAGESKER